MTDKITELGSCNSPTSPSIPQSPQKLTPGGTLAGWVVIKPRDSFSPKPNADTSFASISSVLEGSEKIVTPKRKNVLKDEKPPGNYMDIRKSFEDLQRRMAKAVEIQNIDEAGTPRQGAIKKRRVENTAKAHLVDEALAESPEAPEFEVELLLARKGMTAKYEYLVKWKGYSVAESTWEPVKNLDCREMIRAFEDTLKELPATPLVACDPDIASILEKAHKKAQSNLKWLPKNISDFMFLVSEDTGPSISIVNTVDDQGPPKDFVYIAKSFRGEGVPPLDTAFISGCSCKDSCKLNSKKKCSCLELSCGKMPYSKNGILKLPPKYAIFECTVNCSCPITCVNRVVQRGRTVRLQIFKTLQKGWGVRALEKIPKGRFVAEYVGEIIRGEEAELRGRDYDSQGLTYLFDLDFNYGPEEDCPYTIDAFKYGNISHFINHSCDPNIAVQTAFYESTDLNIHNLAFFATRDIEKNEELCFDYSGGADLPDISELSLSSDLTNPIDLARSERNKKYVCYCGSPKCRKFVHIY